MVVFFLLLIFFFVAEVGGASCSSNQEESSWPPGQMIPVLDLGTPVNYAQGARESRHANWCFCPLCHGQRILQHYSGASLDCFCSPGGSMVRAINFFYSPGIGLSLVYRCSRCPHEFCLRVPEIFQRPPAWAYQENKRVGEPLLDEGEELSMVLEEDFREISSMPERAASITEPVGWCGCESTQVCRCEEKLQLYQSGWDKKAAPLPKEDMLKALWASPKEQVP